MVICDIILGTLVAALIIYLSYRLINKYEPFENTLLSPSDAYGQPWYKPKTFKKGKFIYGSQTPGSAFKCDSIADCPNLRVKGCSSKISDKAPTLQDNLPIGWGSTMSGPYADNDFMMNVNGINKPTFRNPYGYVYPKGDQMYGYAEEGSPNAFRSS